MRDHPCGPVKPDLVILCTGYQALLPRLDIELDDLSTGELSDSGRSSTDGGHCTYNPDNLVRGIWPRDDPSLAFIGFVRPNLGAIPPLAEMQAQLWVAKLLAPSKLAGGGNLRKGDEQHYQLDMSDNPRLKCGVDHESYAYQLTLDMRSAISFSEVVKLACTESFSRRGMAGVSGHAVQGIWYKLPLTWALGANFNTKFRLCGPWTWDGAVDVVVGELWETIARRELVFGKSVPFHRGIKAFPTTSSFDLLQAISHFLLYL